MKLRNFFRLQRECRKSYLVSTWSEGESIYSEAMEFNKRNWSEIVHLLLAAAADGNADRRCPIADHRCHDASEDFYELLQQQQKIASITNRKPQHTASQQSGHANAIANRWIRACNIKPTGLKLPNNNNITHTKTLHFYSFIYEYYLIYYIPLR